jgi:phosphatidate cytidylyltransferase
MFGTIVFSSLICWLTSLPQLRSLLCPQETFELIPFNYETCDPLPDVFVRRHITLPLLSDLIGTIYTSEFSIHCVVIAIFASLVAPFGGFFASGIKRALKIKDFATLIPGHGGLTDRFDCILVISIFVYIYMK